MQNFDNKIAQAKKLLENIRGYLWKKWYTQKTPRSRKDITNYRYYCIKHIRDFNKSWNFFEGLTEEQFENEIRKSTTWDRPSWKFGTSNFNKKVNDTFNFFNDIEDKNLYKKKNVSKLQKLYIIHNSHYKPLINTKSRRTP